jgi:hypothetical protein
MRVVLTVGDERTELLPLVSRLGSVRCSKFYFFGIWHSAFRGFGILKFGIGLFGIQGHLALGHCLALGCHSAFRRLAFCRSAF